jgi:Flp pilus assembly pilin Flp
MTRLYSLITGFFTREHGATFTEYALMLILVAFVSVAVVKIIGGVTGGMFGVANSL